MNILTDFDYSIHTWKHCGVVETSISNFSLKSGGKTRSSSVDRVASSGNGLTGFSVDNSVVVSSLEYSSSGNGSTCFSVENSLVEKSASPKVDSVLNWIGRRFSSPGFSCYEWVNKLLG